MTQGVSLGKLLYSAAMTKSNRKALNPEDGRRKPRPGPEQQSRAVLEASVALFLEHGTRAVSIMQICDAADVSRSTFYRCFTDKDALLHHLYQQSVVEPVEQFMQANLKPVRISPEQMKQTLGDLFEAIFAQGQYAELIFRESNDPSSPAYSVVNSAFDRVVVAMQKVLKPTPDKKVNAIYLKSLLSANQWIAHDTIRKGLTPKNKQIGKEAAWELLSKSLDL